MAVFTTEIEVTSSLSATKLFKVYEDFDTLAPKVDPQTFKAISIIEGDGGVGSIKSITFGDGVPFTNSKQRFDAIDVTNLSVSYTIFGGDALLDNVDSATHHVTFVPSADGGSVYKHTALFNCKPNTQLGEDILNFTKEAFKNTFKAMEAYAIAHPEAY
ncbi:unnamed protein product [Lactuca saligna]|uniref:Bet v I/Major latex protein domain-containing protein n=1 Tax=Lactuca saligna TaxID=75948 RepID=A0AA35ZJT4_LACSI|nr:unnamed protein product [Lactuca saligna]